jgi:hypothetical protein
MKTNADRLSPLLLLFLGCAFSTGGCRAGSASSHNSADAGAASSSNIGIAECDEYVAKVHRCIADHVPGDRKKSLEGSLARNRRAWTAMAANPGTRPALGQSCQLALHGVQTTMQRFSCNW